MTNFSLSFSWSLVKLTIFHKQMSQICHFGTRFGHICIKEITFCTNCLVISLSVKCLTKTDLLKTKETFNQYKRYYLFDLFLKFVILGTFSVYTMLCFKTQFFVYNIICLLSQTCISFFICWTALWEDNYKKDKMSPIRWYC